MLSGVEFNFYTKAQSEQTISIESCSQLILLYKYTHKLNLAAIFKISNSFGFWTWGSQVQRKLMRYQTIPSLWGRRHEIAGIRMIDKTACLEGPNFRWIFVSHIIIYFPKWLIRIPSSCVPHKFIPARKKYRVWALFWSYSSNPLFTLSFTYFISSFHLQPRCLFL